MIEKACPMIFSQVTNEFVIVKVPLEVQRKLESWINEEREADWEIRRLDVRGNLIICKNRRVQLPRSLYKLDQNTESTFE